MHLHEYQAKKLFTEYGIPVPAGKPAHSVKEALRSAGELPGSGWVVKAQVHAGGRGKAGGVKLVRTLEELETTVRAMLGSRLVTRQSGPAGQPVNCVLIQGIADIAREFYLGMLVDRAAKRIALVASPEGGMNIEEVAAARPERILSLTVDPVLGIQHFQTRRIGRMLGLEEKQQQQLHHIIEQLYRLFLDKDLSLIEINPLILNASGVLEALDAKISVDDNALFRQAGLEELRDSSQEDEKETIARRSDLNYVTLDGNIACMVNGAGLAMATMDIIKLHGGEPANFLDVGGGATVEKVAEAFKLIVSDDKVEAILVNIFGGIVRCDLIAEGIISAVRQVQVTVPVVVRLEGTNVEAGKKLLSDSGLEIIAADNLTDAAIMVVGAAGARRK